MSLMVDQAAERYRKGGSLTEAEVRLVVEGGGEDREEEEAAAAAG